MTKRQAKLKRKGPKYREAVLRSVVGEMKKHPENLEKLRKEHNLKGKLVRNLISRAGRRKQGK